MCLSFFSGAPDLVERDVTVMRRSPARRLPLLEVSTSNKKSMANSQATRLRVEKPSSQYSPHKPRTPLG